jgi:hypothetical protein
LAYDDFAFSAVTSGPDKSASSSFLHNVARFGVIDRSVGGPPCARLCRRTDARKIGSHGKQGGIGVSKKPILRWVNHADLFRLKGV